LENLDDDDDDDDEIMWIYDTYITFFNKTRINTEDIINSLKSRAIRISCKAK
jgi:hypothetical protein